MQCSGDRLPGIRIALPARVTRFVSIGLSSSLVAAALLIGTPSAGAQTANCVSSPGSSDCAEKTPQVLAPQLFDRPREKRSRDFFLPNGNLTPPGEFSLSIHELGVYNIFAYGLHKNIEVSVSAPVVPGIATLGGRFSLLPLEKTRFRAVLGLGLHIPILDERDEFQYWAHASGTVAYHGERFDVHATFTQMYHDRSGLELPSANIGGNVQVSRNYALHANYASLNTNGTNRCNPCRNPRINAVFLGAKYMGLRWDIDFGFVAFFNPDDDDIEPIPLPMVSFHRIY